MEQQLILNGNIYGNLRRTLKKHLLSSKSVFQINDLALKYFGIYNDAGELVGYQCPYSGKILTSTKSIVLEHMLSVNLGGGTTLFNCIPTSKIVNKNDEKGSKHLIEWWTSSKYWDSDAPQRLEKLVQYILESYEITFNQNEIGYDDIDVEELGDVGYDQSNDGEADLTTTQEEEQVDSTSLISYYGFINDILNELKNYTDISSYQFRLQNLVGQNVFGTIDKQTKIQEFLKELIKNKFEFEDRTELRFVLNIDIESLSKSLENYSEGDMFLELEKRINNIEKILDNNNLSLYSFFEDKNVLNYLDKSIDELTNDDISNLINDINICARDKFNGFINFVLEHDGGLPNSNSNDEKEKRLGMYRNNIQSFDEKRNCINTSLSEEQLKYLHDSEYESLRGIYKAILYKTVERRIETGNKDIKIEYEDLDMVAKIQEYLNKIKGTTIEEQIELKREYKDYIISGRSNFFDLFNEFINYVLEYDGLLPKKESKNEREARLGRYRNNIQHFDKIRNCMQTSLSGEQLKYLHDSEYESLREIYKVILYKIVEKRIETGNKDIKIEYEDLDMVAKIQEYLNKIKGTTIEEQIELKREYKDYIISGRSNFFDLFNEFINYVLEYDGLPPKKESKNEREARLGRYRGTIQRFDKTKNSMKYVLSEEQLKYLHDSEYESLREIYKTILYKTVEACISTGNNDIKIDYQDYDIVAKIQEYLNKRKGTTIKQQIELEREYKDYIVVDSQFNGFIGFVLEHDGLLPSTESKDEREARLGRYRSKIQSFDKKKNCINTLLLKEQLKYLHDSEYQSLREIYDNIMRKAYEKDYSEYIEIDKEIRKENGKVESDDSESIKKGRVA